MVANSLKLYLKLFNLAMGMGGIATVLYSILMFRVRQLEKESSSSHHIAIPWIFHAFLGIGIALCAITTLGHIAANTSSISWLSSYILVILFLLLLEMVIMAYTFLNPRWKKAAELPVNLSDKFDDFIDFVGSYYYIWRWVAWLIFLTEAICVLLATLKIQETKEVESSESEDEDPEHAFPLLGTSTLSEA